MISAEELENTLGIKGLPNIHDLPQPDDLSKSVIQFATPDRVLPPYIAAIDTPDRGTVIVHSLVPDSLKRALVYAGASTAVTVIGLTAQSGNVQAHEQPQTETDTPGAITLRNEQGRVYDQLREFYTHEEIVRELERHGYTEPEEQQNLTLPVGFTWSVTPETIMEREARLGGADSFILDKGETIFGELTEQGMGIGEVKEVLAHNNWPTDVDDLPAGTVVNLPANLDSDSNDASQPQEPATVTLRLDAPDIISQLENMGVKNAYSIGMEAERISNIDATKMHIGDPFQVPANVIPADAEVVWAADAPLEPLVAPIEASPNPVADAPATPPEAVAAPSLEAPVAPPETPSADAPVAPPEVIPNPIEVALIDVLNTVIRPNYGAETVDIAAIGAFVESNFEHPQPAQGISEEAAKLIYRLGERREGFDFVTHPLTCMNEAVATAPMLAFIIAVQDYARQLTTTDERFTQYFGFEFDIGDIISGHHNRHANGRAVDLRTRPDGMGPEMYPPGPVLVSNSPIFSEEFTAELIRFMNRLAYNGEHMLEQVEISSKDVERDITGDNKKGDVVADVKHHGDHVHALLREIFGIELVNPNNQALSCDDPSTGGTTPTLDPWAPAQPEEIPAATPEPVLPPMEEVAPPVVEPAPTTPEVIIAAEWAVDPNYREIIASSNLEEHKKQFLIDVTDAVMNAVNNGALINPRVVIAQAIVESGWGEGKGAEEGFNIFSVKASAEWAAANPDKIVKIYDDEYDENRNRIESSFKKYGSAQEALDDYIRMITTADHYQDSVACRGTDEGYLNGLIHELRQDCSIGRIQGEDGVLSYATNQHYSETIMSVINNSPISQIVGA